MKNDRAFIAAAAVLIAAIAGLWAAVFALDLHLVKRKLPLRQPLYLLGDRLGSYTKLGEDPLSHEVIDEMKADSFVLARYQDNYAPGGASTVRLLLAYHTGEPDARPFVSDRSYPLGAAKPEDARPVTIPLKPSGMVVNPDGSATVIGPRAITVTLPATEVPAALFHFTPQGGKQPVTVIYFYIANGRFYADPTAVRDAVFDLHAPASYWAKIELHFWAADDAKALADAQHFFSEAMPHLLAALPESKPGPASLRAGPGSPHSALRTPNPALVTVPLPNSAMMGVVLIGGVMVFARFPSSARRRRRLRSR